MIFPYLLSTLPSITNITASVTIITQAVLTIIVVGKCKKMFGTSAALRFPFALQRAKLPAISFPKQAAKTHEVFMNHMCAFFWQGRSLLSRRGCYGSLETFTKHHVRHQFHDHGYTIQDSPLFQPHSRSPSLSRVSLSSSTRALIAIIAAAKRNDIFGVNTTLRMDRVTVVIFVTSGHCHRLRLYCHRR